MNIPNILTTLRFILIPLFIIVFYSSLQSNVLFATYIFILAGATDVLDGYIARSYNMVTKLGVVLDPLADKLMLITVLICFTTKEYIPIWIITVVGIKELLMIIGGLILYYNVDNTVIPANKYGKIATVSFYIGIIAIAFEINNVISYILITLAVSLTLLAFINYMINFRKTKLMIDK